MVSATKVKSTVKQSINTSNKVIKIKTAKTAKTTKTTYVPIDVFQWDTKTDPKVKSKDRPENVLDKQPDDHDARSLESLVLQFLADPICEITFKNIKKNKKPRTGYAELPYYQAIPLKELLSALSVQRPINNKHVGKILTKWDSKKVQYVNVLKIKFNGVYFYYIIDGQHTAVSYGVNAIKGKFDTEVIKYDESTWTSVPVKCQVVEYNNFRFAREHFLGINGDDKLKLAEFDRWSNLVLGKRQDSPDEVTDEHYEEAFSKQEILESYDIIPVHKSAEFEIVKPGAFPRIDLIKNVSDEDLHWVCNVHKLNFDHRELDAVEVEPMVTLRNKIKGIKDLNDPDLKQFIIHLGNIIKNVAGSPAKFKLLSENTWKTWYETVYPNEKIPNEPRDAALALLLQMYYEHGGTFTRLSKVFLDEYTSDSYQLFNALDDDLQTLIRM